MDIKTYTIQNSNDSTVAKSWLHSCEIHGGTAENTVKINRKQEVTINIYNGIKRI